MSPAPPPTAPSTRAGYVTLVGRPNAGKSTLLNRFVGQHLSIVTPKAQTTWQRVTGIVTTDEAQLVFLDTPGLLETRDLLQRSMLAAAYEALEDADVVLVVVDTRRPPASRDTGLLARALEEVRVPAHAALNKVDAAERDAVDAWAAWCGDRGLTAHRVSAATGAGCAELLDRLAADLPASPFLYPDDDIATAPVRFFVAELVRETVFEQFEEEIPWSVWCEVEEFRDDDPVYIAVNVYVERRSQKGILIGAGGRAVRALGQAARRKIETFLDAPVYLDLWVKPLKSWRKSRAHLSRMGFRVPEDEDATS